MIKNFLIIFVAFALFKFIIGWGLLLSLGAAVLARVLIKKFLKF